MHILFQFIKEELKKPFNDTRMDFQTKYDKVDIFYALTNESPFEFQDESPVTVKILTIDERGMKVMANSGFVGVVNPSDITSGDYNEENIRKNY